MYITPKPVARSRRVIAALETPGVNMSHKSRKPALCLTVFDVDASQSGVLTPNDDKDERRDLRRQRFVEAAY